jgi:hypothetical protein
VSGRGSCNKKELDRESCGLGLGGGIGLALLGFISIPPSHPNGFIVFHEVSFLFIITRGVGHSKGWKCHYRGVQVPTGATIKCYAQW